MSSLLYNGQINTAPYTVNDMNTRQGESPQFRQTTTSTEDATSQRSLLTEQRTGTISHVSPHELVIRIQQQSACQGCHAQGHCVSTDCKDRYLHIPTSGASTYQVGESVVVEGKNSIGRLAVCLCFILPLLCLIGGVAVALSLGLGEIGAALVGLSVTLIYYVILRLFDPLLRKHIHFDLKKTFI